MPAKICMIVGLGNPGFSRTRHNVGQAFLDYLAKQKNAKFVPGKLYSLARCDFFGDGSEEIMLIRPDIFMNLSGRVVRHALNEHQLSPAELLVAHDDLQKDMGKASIKPGGSASGHKGVESVMSHLNSDKFPRLRIGIGRPETRDLVDTFVLQKFPPTEQRILEETVFPLCEQLISSTLRPPKPAAATPVKPRSPAPLNASISPVK